MKKLIQLLTSINEYEFKHGDGSVVVSSITLDSRNVTVGSLFIAKRGETVDGHNFIVDAIGRGASGVVGEFFTEDHIQLAKNHNVNLVRVSNSVHVGGVLVAAFYDFPFTKMTMIGITGTDGKTTTTSAVYDILKSLGKSVGLISTVSAKMFNGTLEVEMDTGLHVTTPEVTEIQRLLAQMAERGCKYAIVECTSHGFNQGRLVGIAFDIVGITNITHEHTDYHKTFDNYLRAKAKIFEIDPLLPEKRVERVAYINADDEQSFEFRQFAQKWELRTYSISGGGILNSSIDHSDIKGSTFSISGHVYQTSLVGTYNVANVTLAIGVCHAAGFSFDSMVSGVAQIISPPGRFEVIDLGDHGTAIIDFAHTPHAMDQVVSFVRNHSRGTLFVVFGCAGLRDVEKRPMMGRIAGRLADVTIVTAEDPRTESVKDISDQIISGLVSVGAQEIHAISEAEGNSYMRIEDRFEAIKIAITAAKKNDVIMILGKGHEKSMCFGTTEVPWSDRIAVEKVLKEYN